MTLSRVAASALAVTAAMLIAASLLDGRAQRASVLVDAQRSLANAENRRSGAHGVAQTHQLAVHGGEDYGDDKIFSAGQVFFAGDSFGDHNHFGSETRFAAATRFGDDNSFGHGSVIPGAARFGPGNNFEDEVTIGAMATLGAGAKIGKTAVVGENSAFGPQAEVGADSVLAGGVIFSGGDHFGAGIHFGPNTRFGPNTVFDGAEVFSQGCTFGDNTKFNAKNAGKDTFEGNHYFGEAIDWGGNDPLPPHPEAADHGAPPPQPYAAGDSSQGDAGLPPGYTKTSIPGVYQYTAPVAAADSTHQVEWQWNHPAAVPLDPAGLQAPPASSLASHRAAVARAREHVLHRLKATAGEEERAARRGEGVGQEEAAARASLSSWLRSHPRLADQAPALAMAASPLPRPPLHKALVDRASALRRSTHAAPSPSKLDGFEDDMVRVSGTPLQPQAQGRAQSVVDDMF